MEAVAFAAASGSEQAVQLSKKEKQQLVQAGVAQYEAGNLDEAQKILEQAEAVFPENYVAPYYLGLIYLKQDRQSDTIAQWQRYVALDPKSENSMKIRKYLTLLLRRQAEAFARQAVADEDALLAGPVEEQTLAVAPFQNLGSVGFDSLGKGMAAMLITDLSQVPDLQVIERVNLQALLTEMKLGASGLVSPQSATKVGRLLKAKHVTSGSIADLEQDNLQIASVVMDTEQKRRIGAQEAAGALNKFFELEKQIACGIVEDLGHHCDRMPGAFKKIHTKRMSALVAYSNGLDDMDHERYDEARAMFQKALDEDPDFELAASALLATPYSMMVGMTTADIITGASAGGVPSAAAGTAVVGGIGLGTTTAVIAGIAVAGGALALAAGSGGGGGGDDGGTTPSPKNISGDWRGSWTEKEGTGSGEINLSLSQSDTSINGTASVTGSECISTGTVSGNISGDQVTLTIVSGAEQATFSAVYNHPTMNGELAYTTGACRGEVVTVATTLTGGANVQW